MISIVIPSRNEADRISETLDNCKYLPVDVIITIVNGCIDTTKDKIQQHFLNNKIQIIEFSEPLGIDVPRAIGAAYAYKLGSHAVLFLDGDMTGNLSLQLNRLIDAVIHKKIDMALTNCYPYIYNRPFMAKTVLSYRERLNRRLGVFSELGLASPSHGPHAVSKKLLEKVPWKALAIPPLSLAIAVQHNLSVKVATSIPHNLLLSPLRNNEHSRYIAETIIGDCLEALRFLEDLPPSRQEDSIFYLGYHPKRRFDILDEYVQSLKLNT